MKTATGFAAMASVTLWAFDFIRLPRYELVQEAKLFTVHVVLGSLIGVLIALTFRDKLSTTRLAAVSVVFTFTLGGAALLAMVATYPQVFADRWWLGGGVLARLQVLVTHTIGPTLFDVLCSMLVASVVLLATVRGIRGIRDRSGRRNALAVAAAALVVVALHPGLPAGADVAERPLNVLIVASESLAQVESEATMPYTAARVPDGSLYRYAVTPIARGYPGWVSTLTGTEPRAHGVRHSYPSVTSRRDVGPTLFTALRDRGYYTFVSADAAGSVFSGFTAGFEASDAPRLDLDALEAGARLHRHRFSLALLRFRWFRRLFPEWRSVPMLADPEWVVDDALEHLESGERPFAGLVLFGSSRAPYLAPHPYYKSPESTYRGRYLYHRSPIEPPEPPSPEDLDQIEKRYLGALSAIDRAIERLLSRVDERTLVVITGAFGESIAGPGDTVQSVEAQAAPVLLFGPDVPANVRSNAQVRLYDLPATVLDLLGGRTEMGHGVSLLDEDAIRPVCVESGIWLEGSERDGGLAYPGISQLVDVDPSTDEMVLRADVENLVESAKERGLILGDRLYREQMTTRGFERQTLELNGPELASNGTDLPALFEERCVASDPNLSRLYGAVVFERPTR